MRSLRAALIFVGTAGLAAGLFVASVRLTSSRETAPGPDVIVALLVGWSFIGTGLFAWWRRPLNRTGMLMTAVGFTWFISSLTISDVPGVFIFGVALNNLVLIVLAYLVFAFPSGRLDSKYARWLIWFGFFDGVVLQFLGLLVLRHPTPQMNCADCPSNPLALTHNADLFTVLNHISAIGGVILLSAMVALLVRRRRTLGSAARRAIAPVMFAGGFTLAMFAAMIGISLFADESIVGDITHLGGVLGLVLVPYAFLFGLMRARFGGAEAVGELIESLTDADRREGNIRDALSEALGDPSLQFAYWLPDLEIYVDDLGEPVTLPDEGAGRAWSAVEHDGELIAAIIFDATVEDHRRLVRSAGAAAALALRNRRLEAELRAKVAELRASRARIVQAADETRRRLERNLHDGAQQQLISIALNLRLAKSKLEENPTAAGELIDQAANELATATDELRELARGIHPAVLSDHGLAAAVEALASRSTVPVELGELPERRLPEAIESAIYFVVAEALTNVARYAGEVSGARVAITANNGLAQVIISDDGAGGADPRNGTGLRGLTDRVAALDGKLKVFSPPGEGTRIEAEIPCAS
ncbi:MAG: sensor histidine kinase [Actinobacteria bacterium]|nr:sensor histidine kinase [Actinomycetota bacterium]